MLDVCDDGCARSKFFIGDYDSEHFTLAVTTSKISNQLVSDY